MVEILIKVLALLGACVVAFMLGLLFSKLYNKIKDWFNEKARERRKILSAKHKIKIPVYCCECENWGSSKKPNKPGCPMSNYWTGEYEYCSRGTKEK